ncbi:unnamed protein product [Cylicocyclus nassatus]|uniref:Fucosyltransferase n=1 Tax=Cylicocyclus nassatus TaxID=53992 RepID=A0AA36DL39_CYLNA|nr:unnamed protein product [Cylicocyclus nassatus]
MPLIAFWTTFPRKKTRCDEEITGLLPGAERCAYQCKLIDRQEEKLYTQSASAYLFHGSLFNHYDLPKPSSRYLNVLLLREAPIRVEMWWGGQIYKLFMALRKKTKGSLFFISNCRTPSRRERKIRELSKFTEITARGKCEKFFSINGSAESYNCKSDCTDDDLIATHRFYIAFENSNCDDYITEKFYSRISKLLVPVVSERRIYRGIPSYSFIAADDFSSLRDLGNYLNYLRRNDTAYLRLVLHVI